MRSSLVNEGLEGDAGVIKGDSEVFSLACEVDQQGKHISIFIPSAADRMRQQTKVTKSMSSLSPTLTA